MKQAFAKYIGLSLVIIVATVLRFWQLGQVPPSPDWDEAALGYNAYSILKTGRDEYGTRLPLTLRSFDDYKPPLYTYLVVPSIAVFGLSTWSVRLPAAIIGVIAVVGTYILVVQLCLISNLTKTSKFHNLPYGIGYLSNQEAVPLISSLLLALSPWHIQFSRIAFEAGIGVAINIWAVALFLRFIREGRHLWISAVLFGLGLYAYHSERIFLPILVGVLCLVCWRELVKQKLNFIVFVVVGIITVLPLVSVLFNTTTFMRLRGTSSLADQTGLLKRSVSKLEYDKNRGDVIGVFFENRRFTWARTLVSGYISHFQPKWLFLSGDNARHHAPDMGMLYLWELPVLLWGMYTVSKGGGKRATILWSWFFIAPIAAAPTTELPHGIRTLVFLPVFQIFTAFGIFQAIKYIYHHVSTTKHSWQKLSYFKRAKTTTIRSWMKRYQSVRSTLKANQKTASVSSSVFYMLGCCAYIVFIASNITYYLHMYFVHTNHEYSRYWQYGYKETVDYAQSVRNRYRKIVVSTSLEQPHMFFLFFLTYDPKKYLSYGGTASGGFREERNKFDIYEFRPINWEKESRDGSILYIGTPLEIPNPIHTIDYLDGTEAIRIGDH